MNNAPRKTIPVHPRPSVVAPDRLSDLNAATLSFGQLKLFEILSDFDTRKLTRRIEEKPELYFPLINAFCTFSRLQLAREKFEWQKKEAEARQRAREQKQRRHAPVAISADTLRSVRTAMQSTAVSTHTPAVQQASTTAAPKLQRSTWTRGAFLELKSSDSHLTQTSTPDRRLVRASRPPFRRNSRTGGRQTLPEVDDRTTIQRARIMQSPVSSIKPSPGQICLQPAGQQVCS